MIRNMTKVYIYKNCDGCRRAKKWLVSNGHEFEEVAIREQPPSVGELKLALVGADMNVKKLFNVSGQDYRALNMKEKLPKLSADEAIELLAGNGNLVKRPFLVTERGALAGFNEDVWSELL